jgi:3-hydroxyisobutyrate dehydrogenase-like beta-hydroxyacid dehydrogenase
MRVAWIGLGRVGKPMALRVLHAGHELTGHARTPDKAKEIAAVGGRVVAELSTSVADAEIVCVNVYSEPQLEDALITGGALATMSAGAILVIHSTVGPAIIHDLTKLRPDIDILDAAFSGTDRNAEEGTITLMVGGDATALERARPVLSTYASVIHHVGPSGAGLTIKLVNNALFGAHMLLARDSLQILESVGISKDVAVSTLNHSSGGSFAVAQFENADIDARMAGIWPYMQKDVAAAREAAKQMGFDLGMLDIATRPFITQEP